MTNEQKKKFSKQKSVSYNRIKQKFRKWLQGEGEGEDTFEKQLEKYKLNPVEEAEEEDDSDASSDSPKKPAKGAKDAKK